MAKSDDDAFRMFVTERLDRWRRTAYLLCRDPHVADDLVSIVLGRLYRHWRKVSRADNPDAYAQRVLARTWLSEVRRPWHREIAENTDTGGRTGPFVRDETFEAWPGESVPPSTRSVHLKLADGRILTIMLGNVDGQQLDPAPLAPEQLVAIATDLAAQIRR
jgi:DNA-directed RNA polymerase specialized sigma24 family protein